MGCRLHVATQYKVEFGGDWFNHCTSQVVNFLLELCDDDDSYVSDDYRHIEIPKESFVKGIKTLREYETSELPVSIQDMGYTPNELADIFTDILDMSAKDNEIVILSCW